MHAHFGRFCGRGTLFSKRGPSREGVCKNHSHFRSQRFTPTHIHNNGSPHGHAHGQHLHSRLQPACRRTHGYRQRGIGTDCRVMRRPEDHAARQGRMPEQRRHKPTREETDNHPDNTRQGGTDLGKRQPSECRLRHMATLFNACKFGTYGINAYLCKQNDKKTQMEHEDSDIAQCRNSLFF